MACNWLMMISSGDDNRPSGSLGLLTDKTKKNKIKNKPKAEQETAQPTAARFKNHCSSIFSSVNINIISIFLQQEKSEHIFLCMFLRKQGYHVKNFARKTKAKKLQMLALKK